VCKIRYKCKDLIGWPLNDYAILKSHRVTHFLKRAVL
jgi:hypothetical protein